MGVSENEVPGRGNVLCKGLRCEHAWGIHRTTVRLVWLGWGEHRGGRARERLGGAMVVLRDGQYHLWVGIWKCARVWCYPNAWGLLTAFVKGDRDTYSAL